MRYVYGALFLVLGAILAFYGAMHGYGQIIRFESNLADPEKSQLVTYAKLLIPLIAFYLSFRAIRAGVRKFKDSPVKASAA